MNSTGPALPIGFRVHWYEILGVLGKGGFGITYLAQDTNLHQQVAIKEYLPTDFAERGENAVVRPLDEKQVEPYTHGLKRFLEEARTLARFRHPNIVVVHSVFEANDTAYMVMEYEQGHSLAEAYRTGRVATERDILRTLIPLLDGLGLVHEAGFIHRDIKPENILLRGDDQPVLIDFGSAREAIGDNVQLTSVLTPGYAPFEQWGMSQEVRQGPWTDIYALAATVYRGITGTQPENALTRATAILHEHADPLAPVAELCAGRFSDAFLKAIDKALAFKPDDRTQSVEQWRQQLAEAVHGVGLTFVNAGSVRRLTRKVDANAEDLGDHDDLHEGPTEFVSPGSSSDTGERTQFLPDGDGNTEQQAPWDPDHEDDLPTAQFPPPDRSPRRSDAASTDFDPQDDDTPDEAPTEMAHPGWDPGANANDRTELAPQRPGDTPAPQPASGSGRTVLVGSIVAAVVVAAGATFWLMGGDDAQQVAPDPVAVVAPPTVTPPAPVGGTDPGVQNAAGTGTTGQPATTPGAATQSTPPTPQAPVVPAPPVAPVTAPTTAPAVAVSPPAPAQSGPTAPDPIARVPEPVRPDPVSPGPAPAGGAVIMDNPKAADLLAALDNGNSSGKGDSPVQAPLEGGGARPSTGAGPTQPAAAPDVTQIRNMLDGDTCSAVDVEQRVDGEWRISGYSGRDYSAPAALQSALAGRRLRLDVTRVAVSYCGVLEALSAHWRAARESGLRTSVQVSQPGGRFVEGQELTARLELARASDHFHLDYFTADGDVVHLVPNLASQANRGASRTVDVGKGEEWTISEPFGDDLLLLVTTDQPLFGRPREDAEGAADYLRALSDRLARVAGSGRTAGIALLPISTRPRDGN